MGRGILQVFWDRKLNWQNIFQKWIYQEATVVNWFDLWPLLQRIVRGFKLFFGIHVWNYNWNYNEFYCGGKHSKKTYTDLRSNSIGFLKFPIRTRSAWELRLDPPKKRDYIFLNCKYLHVCIFYIVQMKKDMYLFFPQEEEFYWFKLA